MKKESEKMKTRHVSEEDMFRLLDRDVTVQEKRTYVNHIRTCARCKPLLREAYSTLRKLQLLHLSERTKCPSPSVLFDYQSKVLDRKKMEEVEQHVMTCNYCKEELEVFGEVEVKAKVQDQGALEFSSEELMQEVKAASKDFIKNNLAAESRFFDALWGSMARILKKRNTRSIGELKSFEWGELGVAQALGGQSFRDLLSPAVILTLWSFLQQVREKGIEHSAVTATIESYGKSLGLPVSIRRKLGAYVSNEKKQHLALRK